MIDAEDDVLDAEAQVGRGAARGRWFRAEHDRGCGGPQQVAFETAVGVVDAHDHVGHGGLEPGDRDRGAGQPAVAHERAARDRRAGERALAVAARHAQPSGRTGTTSIFRTSRQRLLPQERVGRPRLLRAARGSPVAARARSPPRAKASSAPARSPARRVIALRRLRRSASPMTTVYFSSRRVVGGLELLRRRRVRSSRSTAGRTAARSGSIAADSLAHQRPDAVRSRDSIGPAQVPGSKREHRVGEGARRRSRATSDRGSERQLLRRHQRIPHRFDLDVRPCGAQLREQSLDLGIRRVTASIAAHVDLPEGDSRLFAEPLRVGLEKGTAAPGPKAPRRPRPPRPGTRTSGAGGGAGWCRRRPSPATRPLASRPPRARSRRSAP